MQMKTFKKPFCEVVYFGNSIIATSGSCGCDVGGIVFETNTVCTGGNVTCTCNPNNDDPSANCVPAGS